MARRLIEGKSKSKSKLEVRRGELKNKLVYVPN
jgi:hypothetical protein